MTDQARSTSTKPPSKRLADLLPIPAISNPSQTIEAETLSDKPTLSHALAMDSHADERGLAQQAYQIHHEKEIMDLGWNEREDEIEDPLVGGLENEELWLLVRRFNKVRFREDSGSGGSQISHHFRLSLLLSFVPFKLC